MRGVSFEAKFLAFDAFHKPFHRGLLPLRSYDAVSCQFAFHYSFSSEQSARNAVANVASVLNRGGYFFGIIPDAQEIRRRLMDPETCKDGGKSIRNQFYELVMDEPVTFKHTSPYGIRYEFTLIDAVDTCPEYIVPFSVLRKLCEAQGMEHVLEAPLPQFYETFAQIPEYQQLLDRMNIMNEQELVMCQDERDIACKKMRKQYNAITNHIYSSSVLGFRLQKGSLNYRKINSEVLSLISEEGINNILFYSSLLYFTLLYSSLTLLRYHKSVANHSCPNLVIFKCPI